MTSPEVNRKDLLRAYEKKIDLNHNSHHLMITEKPPTTAKYHQFIKGHSHRQLAGADMSETIEKLSNESNYTGVYRNRLAVRDGKGMVDMSERGTGELCSSPKRARNLLMSTRVADLNMPGRSGDYRNEVEWRLQLRPSLSNH